MTQSDAARGRHQGVMITPAQQMVSSCTGAVLTSILGNFQAFSVSHVLLLLRNACAKRQLEWSILVVIDSVSVSVTQPCECFPKLEAE